MDMQLNPGDRVLVIAPDNWVSEVARKIQGREGVVRFCRSDRVYIVDFPAAGRRKAFTHHFYGRDLTKVKP